MKTIKFGGEIIRVSNEEAVSKVEKGGWAYASKEEWKKKVRDAKGKTNAPVAAVSSDKPEVEKAEKVKEDEGVMEQTDSRPKSEGFLKYQAKKATKKSGK